MGTIIAKTGYFPEPVYSGGFNGYENSNQALSRQLGQSLTWDEDGLEWEVTVSGGFYENVPVHNQTYSLFATW
jgi:hypothetical protein